MNYTYKFANMWRQAREDAGISQEESSRLMGVSKTTIQNWESGQSCPNQLKGFEYFKKLGLQPLPYYLEIFYPRYKNTIESNIDDVLYLLIRSLPEEEKKKMFFCMTETRGSAVSVLEMLVAHLLTPMECRITVASHILLNYEMSKANNILKEGEVDPNIDLLKIAIERAKQSIINGETSYTSIM